MQLRVLYQDPYLVAVDKPAGFHVHPPEDLSIRVTLARTCLETLKKQTNQYIYTVHRLDYATSGVLLFALDSATAREIGLRFQAAQMKKTYYTVVRGWILEDTIIDRPLSAESTSETAELTKLPSVTRIRPLARIELPDPVGRYTTARYTLIEATPETGRFHQIRRHLSGSSHPIIGDTVYGDGAHNRYFREKLGFRALLLKAQTLEFQHPQSGEPLLIRSKWNGKWHQVFNLFGVCPN